MAENGRIRHASEADLERIAELESLCFSVKAGASADDFINRLKVFPDYFWLLELDGKLIAMIDGMVTDEPDLKDVMYHNADMHNRNGKWQMIFGVETHPDFQGKGYASLLMNRVIENAISEGREGLVLTCKERLIPFYERFGFINEGVSDSEHGDIVWYQMRKKL